MNRIIKTGIGFLYGLIKKISLKNTLSVFIYHDVTDRPSEWSDIYDLNITPAVFDLHISFIKRHFNVISPDDLLAGRIPDRAALITFDDGLKNVFTNAVPIIKRHGLPAIIFVNMGTVKGELSWSGLITYLCDKKPDFAEYLKTKIKQPDNRALFLHCSKTIVEAYLKKTGQSFEKEVRGFVGEFATEEDLRNVSHSSFIFYGNHLYNHHVALLMSDEELLDSFKTNAAELQAYPNYRPLFAFPFGQPGTCFSESQVELLLANGAKKVFSSYGSINTDVSSPYLHRIGLLEYNDSHGTMWYKILRFRFRK